MSPLLVPIISGATSATITAVANNYRDAKKNERLKRDLSELVSKNPTIARALEREEEKREKYALPPIVRRRE